MLVSQILIEDDPEPEISWVGVTASEKMSVGCAEIGRAHV